MSASFALVLILCILCNVETARILAVFPMPVVSHQLVFHSFIQELAKNGHEIVFITPIPFSKEIPSGNITKIEMNIDVKKLHTLFEIDYKGNSKKPLKQLEFIFKTDLILIDDLFETEDVKKIIKENKKFDLLLVEALFRPGLIFRHIFKTPVILLSSYTAFVNNYASVGGPDHPILYTSGLRQRNHNLTLWEKVNEVYNYYQSNNLYNGEYAKLEDEKLKQHFGKGIPSVKEMVNHIDMIFVNTNPIFEGIRPVPPSVVHLGGLHLKPLKELPQDLKSYLDSSTNGVIYFSLGSTLDPVMFSQDKIQKILKVLSELPYNIVLKWNEENLPYNASNILISKWLPQADLLRHPNIKLFITQAGLQSTDEAIAAGVPLIGIPLAFDQFHNAEKYEHHKIGLKLDFESLTEEGFRKAIKTVVENKSYHQNIVKLRELMLDQPQRPLERAVWWTEHVLRHGGAAHLRSPAANISWTQYLEIELVFLLIAVLMLIFVIFVIVYRLVCELYNILKMFKINRVKTKLL